MQSVTSRGCSRIYVLCVLWRGLDYVKRMKAEGRSVVFPFDTNAIFLPLFLKNSAKLMQVGVLPLPPITTLPIQIIFASKTCFFTDRYLKLLIL